MTFCFACPFYLLKQLLLGILAVQSVHGIVTKPLLGFPFNGHEGAGHHQVVGIITGPSASDWSPSSSSFSWNYYLNRQCQSDNDCYTSRTLLYCISNQCQCITGGATHINGLFYNYNMEWSESTSQCISQVGSPCTLKRYWYSSEIIKMDCVQGHECVEIVSPAAKATLSGQSASGYGSAVSVNQQLYQTPPLSYYQQLQYFGSGVASLTNPTSISAKDNFAGQRPQAIAASGGSDPAANSWGICVRRLDIDINHDGISGTGELSGVPSSNSTGYRHQAFPIFCTVLGLSLSVLLFFSMSHLD